MERESSFTERVWEAVTHRVTIALLSAAIAAAAVGVITEPDRQELRQLRGKDKLRGAIRGAHLAITTALENKQNLPMEVTVPMLQAWKGNVERAMQRNHELLEKDEDLMKEAKETLQKLDQVIQALMTREQFRQLQEQRRQQQKQFQQPKQERPLT